MYWARLARERPLRDTFAAQEPCCRPVSRLSLRARLLRARVTVQSADVGGSAKDVADSGGWGRTRCAAIKL